MMKYVKVFGLLLLTTILLIACGRQTGEPPQSEPTDEATVDMSAETFDYNVYSIEGRDAFRALLNLDAEPPAPEEALDNPDAVDMYIGESDLMTDAKAVNDAFEAGTIDQDTHAYYEVLLAYDKDAMPEQYRGESAYYGYDPTFALKHLAATYDTLPEDLKAAVLPYMVEISDPASYFNPNRSTETEQSHSPIIGRVHADSPLYIFSDQEFTFDGVTFTISYYLSETWSENERRNYETFVTWLIDAIEHSYPKEKELLGISLTSPVKIEITPNFSGDGEAWHDGQNYRIRLNPNSLLTEKDFRSVFAHELFHNFQDEMDVPFAGSATKWACEATATWSEHYVYPTDNYEHIRHYGFFATTTFERIQFKRLRHYYGYMLFYFLTDYVYGNDIVPEYLNYVATTGEAGARDYFEKRLDDFDELYAIFAEHNLNFGPYQHYKDPDPVIKHVPFRYSLISHVFSAEEEYSKSLTLKPGGIQYYLFDFPEEVEDLDHITFKFEDILPNDNVHIQAAILTSDGNWRLERWDEEKKVFFCRENDNPKDKVTRVFLFFSNGDLKKNGTADMGDFKVITSDCSDEIRIHVKSTYTRAEEDFYFEGVAEFTEDILLTDHFSYLVTNSSYTYSGSGGSEGIAIDTSGSHSWTGAGEPTIEENFPRVILPMETSDPDLAAALDTYGFSENIPEYGYLITVPALVNDPTGHTHMSVPEPIGEMNMDLPLILDGLSQVGAIPLPKDLHEAGSFSFETTINLGEHASPFLNMYQFDNGTLLEQMEALGGGNMPSIPEMPEMPEMPNMPGMSEMPSMPGMDTSGLNGLMNMMNALQASGLSSETVHIEVEITNPD